jgi:hypothetical protein
MFKTIKNNTVNGRIEPGTGQPGDANSRNFLVKLRAGNVRPNVAGFFGSCPASQVEQGVEIRLSH